VGEPATTIIVAGLAALWILLGVALSLRAGNRLRQAGTLVSASRTLRDLLELSPARPVVVRPGGTIEADSRLLRELGISRSPNRLADLAGDESGLNPQDVERLVEAVREAGLTGERVQLQARVSGSGRVLDIRGAPAPAPEPAGTLVLWFFDASIAESERQKLSQRLAQTEAALDALTRLIEAAPFPMWYRGPDLTLGLVNSAFVEAVEGRDAADVIARASELVGDTEEARAAALEAIERGKPLSKKQPAIVKGERRCPSACCNRCWR